MSTCSRRNGDSAQYPRNPIMSLENRSCLQSVVGWYAVAEYGREVGPITIRTAGIVEVRGLESNGFQHLPFPKVQQRTVTDIQRPVRDFKIR